MLLSPSEVCERITPFTTSELSAAARLGRALDTPDQRLTGDVDNLSRALGAMLWGWGGYDGGNGVATAMAAVAASSIVLNLVGAGLVPGIVAFLFAIIATVLTTLLANGSNTWSFRADEAMGL